MIWQYHKETKDDEQDRDFVKLNRDCIKEKYVNAKVLYYNIL